MSFHYSNSMMRAAFLMCSMFVTAQVGSPQSVQTAQSEAASSVERVVSLDPSSAYAAASRPIAEGEASFANAPANFYAFAAARAGETASLEAVKLRFDAATTLAKIESTPDFTVENGGSCIEGQSYAKGDTCIVLMRFTPQGAGRRLGKLTLSHSASSQPASVGLGGFGYAPVISFTPALITTVPGTYPSSKGLLSGAKDLDVDGGDILYIDDIGNNLLREIDSTGAITNISPFFGTPESIAVDNFGNVWAPTASGSTFYFTNYLPSRTQAGWSAPSYTPGSCTESTPCNLINVGLGEPAEITIDSNDNLFMEEETRGALEMPVGGWVDITSTLNLWYLEDVYAYYLGPPATFAVSANDDLFTVISYTLQNDCSIVEEPLYGAEGTTPSYTRVAGGINCGYSGDGGQAAGAEIGGAIGQMAFDLAGNLYFTDTNNQRVRMISAATGIINTVAGSGTAGYSGDNNEATTAKLSYPTGVAVDSQGQVYIVSGTGTTSGGAQVVRKLGVKGYLGFGSQTVGTTSTAHIVTVTNTGNASMTLTSKALTGPNAAAFSIDTTTTSCVLTAGATLYAGQSCQIGLLFKPTATGFQTANLVLLDNTVTNSNIVQLGGTGASSAVKLNPGAVSFPATAQSYTTTVPVTLTNSGNAALKLSSIAVSGTNAASFSSTSGCGTSVAPGATCTLHVTFKPSATGSYAASLKVTDNAPNSPQSIALKGSGVTAVASTTKLAAAANPATTCQPVSFAVTVGGTGAGTPTGTITLKNGATVLATGALSKGVATLSTEKLTAGTSQLTATYGGDATHEPSTSSELAQTVNAGACTEARTQTLGAQP